MTFDTQDFENINNNRNNNDQPQENVGDNEDQAQVINQQEHLQGSIDSLTYANRSPQELQHILQQTLHLELSDERNDNENGLQQTLHLELSDERNDNENGNDNVEREVQFSDKEELDESLGEVIYDLNSQLDNLNTLLNQLEGRSDQLMTNLQSLLHHIRN